MPISFVCYPYTWAFAIFCLGREYYNNNTTYGNGSVAGDRLEVRSGNM